MGWNDRPYPLLPLGDSQPYTYTRPYDYSHPTSALGRLEEREGHPFAARLISRTHLADLR
jgi:hypothetical protein